MVLMLQKSLPRVRTRVSRQLMSPSPQRPVTPALVLIPSALASPRDPPSPSPRSPPAASPSPPAFQPPAAPSAALPSAAPPEQQRRYQHQHQLCGGSSSPAISGNGREILSIWPFRGGGGDRALADQRGDGGPAAAAPGIHTVSGDPEQLPG
nr:chitin-binding lectin 1-like [Penaeus vannamei]